MIVLVPARRQKKNTNFRWVNLIVVLETHSKWTLNYANLSSKQSSLFTHAAPDDVELAVITAWNL